MATKDKQRISELKEALFENSITRNLAESLLVFRANPYYIFFPMLTDLVFIIIYGFIFGFFYNSLVASAYSAGASLVKGSGSSINIYSPDIMGSLYTEALPHLKSIAVIVLLFFAALYVIYGILQGLSWKFAYELSSTAEGTNLSSNKVKLSEFIKRFFAVNILWFFLFMAYAVIAYSLDFIATSRTGVLTKSSFPAIMLALILYFAFISHSIVPLHSPLANLKNAFRAGISKAYNMLAAYLIIMVVLLLVNLAMHASQSRPSLIALGIIIFLPAVTWARVFLMISAAEVSG